jgi:GNAT superfamily N-acetyltransferase
MKLYRHYKNQFYKYIGPARHSETEEELVVYQPAYNDSGLWVRPKQMFFENVEVAGKNVPRFAAVVPEIRETTAVGDAEIKLIAPVIEKAFGQWDEKWFYGKFRNHNKFHLLTAFVDGEAVAFKIGFELNAQQFYSWLGGVVPEFRGSGLASDLMKRQHEWCRAQGYNSVQTKTLNRFRDMFILNLRHGFDVIGGHQSDEGGYKIILEKRLKVTGR